MTTPEKEPLFAQKIGVRHEIIGLVNKLQTGLKDENSGTEDELEQQYWDPFDKSGLKKKSSSKSGKQKSGKRGKKSHRHLSLEMEQEETLRQRQQLKKIQLKKREDLRKEKEKQSKSQYNRDREVIIAGGNFHIQVHIIECRELKGKDWSDNSDPVVTVKILDTKKSTKIIKSTKNPIYDQILYFDFNLDGDELSKCKASITVFDANRLMRNKQIGSFEFDLSEIYYRDDHEIYHQWVALTNTETMLEPDDEDNDKMEVNKGIEGYLRCSVTVLGPNDEQKIHDDADEWKNAEKLDDGMILVTPGITQSPHLLTIKIHKLRNLANADKQSISESFRHLLTKKQVLDPFVYVEYAGVRLRTEEVYSGLDCEVCFEYEIHIFLFS